MRNIAVAFLLVDFASLAEATSITYNLTGTVDQVAPANIYGAPTVVTGEVVPIVITVDPSYPQYSGATPGKASYDNPQTPTPGVLALSVQINGQQLGGLLFEGIDVYTNSKINFNAASPQTDTGGFDITLSGAVPGALPSNAIPLTLDPAAFLHGTFSVTELFDPTVDGFSGTINGLAALSPAVPEPGSMTIVAAGLLGLLLVRLRRE